MPNAAVVSHYGRLAYAYLARSRTQSGVTAQEPQCPSAFKRGSENNIKIIIKVKNQIKF